MSLQRLEHKIEHKILNTPQQNISARKPLRWSIWTFSCGLPLVGRENSLLHLPECRSAERQRRITLRLTKSANRAVINSTIASTHNCEGDNLVLSRAIYNMLTISYRYIKPEMLIFPIRTSWEPHGKITGFSIKLGKMCWYMPCALASCTRQLPITAAK